MYTDLIHRIELEEKKLESKNDTIQEKGMLILLAVSPIVIGFFYYVMVQLPVIGMIWMYAAPFTVLYYWGWVATVFRSHFKSFFKTMVWMNGLGIVMFLLYIWQFVLLKEGEQISVVAVLSQLYTISLGFITTWIGIVLDKGSSLDMETMSVAASVIIEVVSVLLMIAAAAIGYLAEENRDKKKMESADLIEEQQEKEVVEAVFSDRQMEDYELKDAEEAQKQNV